MRSLVAALVAAGFVVFSMSAFSADEPYTAQSKADKPGRAANDDSMSVKSKPDASRLGRTAE